MTPLQKLKIEIIGQGAELTNVKHTNIDLSIVGVVFTKVSILIYKTYQISIYRSMDQQEKKVDISYYWRGLHLLYTYSAKRGPLVRWTPPPFDF